MGSNRGLQVSGTQISTHWHIVIHILGIIGIARILCIICIMCTSLVIKIMCIVCAAFTFDKILNTSGNIFETTAP